MAATLQCLKRVKELKDALKAMNQPQMGDNDGILAFTGGRLMKQLENVVDDVKPMEFVMSLKQAYPNFAETTSEGHPKQQDADECFQSLLQSWRQPLMNSNADKEDVIGNLFECEMENTLKCLESPDEPPTSQNEKVLRLSCHIDNGNKPIDLLQEGLKVSLTG